MNMHEYKLFPTKWENKRHAPNHQPEHILKHIQIHVSSIHSLTLPFIMFTSELAISGLNIWGNLKTLPRTDALSMENLEFSRVEPLCREFFIAIWWVNSPFSEAPPDIFS